MKKSLLLVLAAVAFPTAVSAAATDEIEVVSVDVNYGDLALDKSAGAETLGRRVNAAIQSVCARPESMRNLKAMRAWQECRDAAASSAKAQVTPVLAYGRVTVADRY